MTARQPTPPVPLDPHEMKIEREAAEADASAGTKQQPADTKPKAPNRVVATWGGAMRFDAGRPGGPVLRLDGSGESGQSPVDAVLSALASCTGIDVVEILAKRRTPVKTLEIELLGDRANSVPRRLTRIRLEFRIGGEGIERDQAERAISLSIERYCSVRDSLARDIVIEWRLALNGERGEDIRSGEGAPKVEGIA